MSLSDYSKYALLLENIAKLVTLAIIFGSLKLLLEKGIGQL